MTEAIEATPEVNPEAEARAEALAGWIRAGLGQYALPESREEFAAMPMDVRMRLQGADPALFELFSRPMRLPAEVEARMAAGALTPADGPLVEAAGHLQVAAALKEQVMAEKLRIFEEGHQARVNPEAREAQQQEAEQRRLESEARANAEARSRYVSSLMSGQPQRVADLLPPQALVR